MTTPSIVILILLSYGTAMLLISRRASRRIRSFQDTIAAPGQTSLFLLAGSAIGGQIGSGFVIGGAEYGARYGIAGAWYGIGCGLSYFITAALCRFIRTHHYVSPADYFARRYSGHATRMIYTAASISCSVSLLAGQLLAGRAIFLTLGLPAQWGVVLTAVIALVYSNAAGLWGSMAVSSIPERHYLYRNVHSPVSDDVRSRSWGTGSRSACFQLSSSALWRRIFSLYDCSHRFGKLSEPDLIPERRLCQIPQIGQRRLSSGRTDIDPGRIHSAPAGHVRARFVSRYSR